MPSPSLHLSYWPVRLPHQLAIRPGPNIDSAVLSQATCSLPLILIIEDLRIKRKKQTAANLALLTVCWVSLLSLSPLSRLSPQLSQNLSIHSSLLPVCCVRASLSNGPNKCWEAMAPKSAVLLRTPCLNNFSVSAWLETASWVCFPMEIHLLGQQTNPAVTLSQGGSIVIIPMTGMTHTDMRGNTWTLCVHTNAQIQATRHTQAQLVVYPHRCL